MSARRIPHRSDDSGYIEVLATWTCLPTCIFGVAWIGWNSRTRLGECMAQSTTWTPCGADLAQHDGRAAL